MDEEVLDMAVYLKRELMERAAMADLLDRTMSDFLLEAAGFMWCLAEILTWLQGDPRYDRVKEA